MSTYQRPLSPWDPVVQDQQPKPPIRFIRDNFQGTGQNSHTQPPTQDPSMWQALTNVMPITKGTIERRWGYTQFTGVNNSPNRLYDFQSDSLGTRAIIAAGSQNVSSFTEAGASYNSNIFTPSGTGTIRSITSRNYQYFCDGNNALNSSTHALGDALKWNGNTSGGTTNIGILVSDITSNTLTGPGSGVTIGPDTGTTASDLGDHSNPWTNVSGVFTNSFSTPAFVSCTYNPSGSSRLWSNTLRALGFFNSSGGSSVLGIQVAIKCATSGNGSGSIVAQLVKNGIPVGTYRTASTVIGTNTYSFGSATDTWGTSFVPSDLTSSEFGFQFYTTVSSGGRTPTSITYDVAYVTMTATYSGGTGTTSSSGAGVGVLTPVANGAISLTLGRTYYLVANTATVGHFSDLTVASPNTGACTNVEFPLLLATFNDPQVDTKYVVATADGGDPSILYEVPVLIPGLTVASWSINGSNQITFTGTWTGTPYANGTSFVVGGFVHGSYLNSLTGWTVTSTSPTTLVAAVPGGHATDSATEPGIAGNTSFAIPNGVSYVIDNEPDVDLVLNQPLLFTDQYGNEYGVTLNDPPPAGNLLIKHQGRLWMAGVSGATHSVYFSKSIVELTLPNGFIAGKYEEAWPASNYFDVSDGAESVSGLLTDGTTLYIGTQNHIRRLLGNSPTNFQEPQIIHPQVGLINQEVWQLVYMQGAPSGCIWMTPDFRVMQSDFNTYVDIGHPIQDILNGIQSTAPALAHAAFVADGEYDLYILAIPYQSSAICDTHLIYDLRNQQWFVWIPASGSLSLLYNVTQAAVPQWLFLDSGSNIFQYTSTATTDSGTTIPVTAMTTWLNLGEPGSRKVLNEIDYDGDSALTVTINTAMQQGDFTAPIPMVSNMASVLGPLGTRKFFIASQAIRARYFQFKFQSSSSTDVVIGNYNIESFPFMDL